MKAARHRGETLRLESGVTLLDDCYNSNPVAVEAAVLTLGMAGGRRRVASSGTCSSWVGGREMHRATGERIAAGVDVLVGGGPCRPLLDGARSASGPEASPTSKTRPPRRRGSRAWVPPATPSWGRAPWRAP